MVEYAVVTHVLQGVVVRRRHEMSKHRRSGAASHVGIDDVMTNLPAQSLFSDETTRKRILLCDGLLDISMFEMRGELVHYPLSSRTPAERHGSREAWWLKNRQEI
jgi:hypothetical protein